ncbi:uncharacterized protein SCODWIG_00634 [Saccharomycodes ludwigii]|uniref:Signal recognition particle receptor subunit beta n=1 Tax=Saccharomycodes ludwigii TaxID=36035 RepID=A0A376B2H8_9ASCO|nr:hypothetical protein SCDLUD_004819 [Saccharomycodes ludwigii]KAH3899376.1 hypothetical protein SCDLUD_004819 [Saccharomycodes ludwigii]SSD58873.1 uncharacterized protein SCODWIG_00634 [Saccharomycodes ludwigii]
MSGKVTNMIIAIANDLDVNIKLLLGIIIPIFVVIITSVLFKSGIFLNSGFIANSSSSTSGPVFIVAGPSNSGKTSFLTRLREPNNTKFQTVTTQEYSVLRNYRNANNLTKKKVCNIIDFPGHIRLRYQLLNYFKNTLKNKSNIRGVVFFMDSTVNAEQMVYTAECLLDILNITEKNGIDVLVACNKSDLFASRPSLKIKEQLEKNLKEIINRKKKSVGEKNSTFDNTDDGNDNNGIGNSLEVIMEQLGSDPKFDRLESEIVFKNGSVVNKNIDDWLEWMDEKL